MPKIMLFRLYPPPVVVMIFSLIALFFLGIFVPELFAGKPILDALGKSSAYIAPWIAGAMFTFGIVWSLWQTYNLWRWNNGLDDSCQHCGGMTTLKEGRRSMYICCLACGRKRHL